MTESSGFLVVAPEVSAAISAHRAVVALESALVTHGFAHPQGLAVARAAEAAVREAAAVPATVGVIDGRLRVGLDGRELAELAARIGALKISRQGLAPALVRGTWGGTTVSATMIAAARAGIEVFATGGIGGVHRGGERTFDVSADVEELARTSLVVVCSGAKSILDVDLTLELLETRGVPVVGYGTDELPGFLARGSGRAVRWRVDSPAEAAALYRRQRDLGLESAILLCVPAPKEVAIPRSELEAAIEAVVADVRAGGISGPDETPALLARLADVTRGRSRAANAALIEQNARIAAQVALALSGDSPPA